MDTRARERIMRTIIAALAASEVTGSDVRQLGEDLSTGGPLSQTLGDRLRKLGPLLARDSLGIHGPPETSRQASEVVEDILRLVRRRRLSKAAVLAAIQETTPKWDGQPAYSHSRPTVEDILLEYIHSAGISSAKRLRDKLSAREHKPDPYLEGIMEEQ